MNLQRYAAILLSALLPGCAGFDEPPRTRLAQTTSPVSMKIGVDEYASTSDYARVRLVNVGAQVREIDGKELGPLISSEAGTLLTEAHVSPGSHRITAVYTEGFLSTGSFSSWKEAESELTVNATAGHVYTVRARRMQSNRVEFSIVDHGRDYDAKCGGLFRRPVNPLRAFNDFSTGAGVPARCH